MSSGKFSGGLRVGFWLAVVCLGLGAAQASAQFGVYVGYDATRMSSIACLSSGVPCSNGTAAATGTAVSTGNLNPSGLFVGGFYDWRRFGPVKVGFDARYMDARSNKSAVTSGGGPNMVTSNTVLGGVRASIPTPISWLRPYAQISAGRTSSNVTEPSCVTASGGTLLCGNSTVTAASPRQYDSFFTVEGFAGLDIHITGPLTLRAVEVGYGNMNRLGGGTAGTTSSVGLASIGGGVVFTFPLP